MQCLKKLFYTVTKSQYMVNKTRESKVLNILCRYNHELDVSFEKYEESEEERTTYAKISETYLGSAVHGNQVYVIQPYIKWGFDKKKNTTPQLQLDEAVALINTLPNWNVVGKKLVPLLTLARKQLVGTGNLNTLKKEIKSNPNVTAIFVSTNSLKFIQIAELQKLFNMPIYDRYSIVIQIFREHAKTSEAKLQVALAELPYIKQKMIDFTQYRIGRINFDEKTKLMLQTREKRLKNALKKLKEHRHLIRQQRQNHGFPCVAVVGYTNAGKTSLIKALTGDAKLQPEDKLFATLDTTVHQGLLLNRLKVLYVDTIGFIQDVPDNLIEPFAVTLEDAMNADVLVHVFDISHPDVKAQIDHVKKTIQSMVHENKVVINVANKCDTIEKDKVNNDILSEDTFVVSATKLTGIDLLRSKIEEDVMKAADIVKKRIRVRTGSTESSWLYKETTVLSADPDSENSQFLIMDVIMSTAVFYKLKRTFKV